MVSSSVPQHGFDALLQEASALFGMEGTVDGLKADARLKILRRVLALAESDQKECVLARGFLRALPNAQLRRLQVLDPHLIEHVQWHRRDGVEAAAPLFDARVLARVGTVVEEDVPHQHWRNKRYAVVHCALYERMHQTGLYEVCAGLVHAGQKFRTSHEQALQASLTLLLHSIDKAYADAGAGGEQARVFYRQVCDAFRTSYSLLQTAHKEACSDKHYLERCKDVLKHCAHTLYTGVPMRMYTTSLVRVLRGTGLLDGAFAKDSDASVWGRLHARLLDTQDRLLRGGHVVKRTLKDKTVHLFRGELGLGFDPTRQGNIPYVLFRVRLEGRVVTCLRMGTPTFQKTAFDPDITPEFKLFLEALPDGERFLYINRQRRSFVEGGRSEVLEGYASHPLYRRMLDVVSVPADGDVVNASGEYASHRRWDAVCETLAQAMVENKDGFYFSPRWIERCYGSARVFKSRMKALLERLGSCAHVETHQHLDSSTQEQFRRAMVYHFLNKTLVEECLRVGGASFYCNTCKDAIDRGATANAYFYALTCAPLEAGAAQTTVDAYISAVETCVFAPALLVRHRAVQENRFEALLGALQWLGRGGVDVRGLLGDAVDLGAQH